MNIMYAILLYGQFMTFMQPYIAIYDSMFYFCFFMVVKSFLKLPQLAQEHFPQSLLYNFVSVNVYCNHKHMTIYPKRIEKEIERLKTYIDGYSQH